MRFPRLLAILLAFVCVLAPASAAGPWPQDSQGGERDPKKAIEGFQRYLERKPYHDWAYDKLVENAITVNALGELIEEYAALVEEDPGALAPRIVLARLQASMDRIDDALELLAEVDEKDASYHRLVGALQLRAGRWDEAVRALDEAAAATTDPQLLEEIHKERGKAHLAAGNREAAAQAFEDLAALDPESFHLRLETASELAWHGLTEQALVQFARAEELAGDDTSKRCQVLSETGRLHERLAQGEEAVATYRTAIALMARGHWLKRDLYERILAIHQRAGTLDQLVAEAQVAAEDAADLDAREFLARVEIVRGEREEARDVLQAATVDFPSDLPLSRQLLTVLDALEDDQGRIAEYQRILTERPDELELYLELGQVFAGSGQFEQARRQWNKTLEKRLSDAGLCSRLAGMYALFGQVDDAVAMYEKAIALEPNDVRHYSELAAFLVVQRRREDVPPVLERADAAAVGDANRLGEVASLWNEYGQPERARTALESALDLDPANAQFQSRLADALIRAGEIEPATALLHEIVDTASESGLRSSAVDRIIRLFRRQERLDDLLAMEEEAVAADPKAIAPRLVLGRLRIQRREPDLAIETYRELLALGAESEDARKALGRLYEDRGQFDEALAQYEAIIEARPQARRATLKEIARIHLARYDQERAFECYDEILRGAPDNPAAFKEVADAYDKLGLHDKRLECLQQAVRLKPNDAETRLDLSEAWRTMGEFDRAREEITEATRVALDQDTRQDARQKLYLLLAETGQLEDEIVALRNRVDENPYDMEAPLMLTDFYVRELEYQLALEMLDNLIRFQPKEARLMKERARLYRLMDRHDEAIADYEALWKLPDTDRNEISLDLAEAIIESGDVARASEILGGVNDVRKVAAVYRRHDLFDQAIEVLEKGVAGSPGNDRLLQSLASTQEDVGDLEAASLTLERLLALRGNSWRVLMKLADLYHDMGRKDESLEVAKRMFGLLRIEEPIEEEDDDHEKKQGVPYRNRSTYRYFRSNQQYNERLSALQRFFREKGWMDEFVAIGLREMSFQPTNSDLYGRIFGDLRNLGERQEDMRTMVRAARVAFDETGRTPAGLTSHEWKNRLERDEATIYSGQSGLTKERIAELDAAIADDSATAVTYRELAQLYQNLQQDADKVATVRAGVGAFPESIELRTGLAMTLFGEKLYEESASEYAVLVELIESSEWPAREIERLEESFKKSKRNTLQRFPLHVQPRVNDEVLRRSYFVTAGPSTRLRWTLGSEPSLDGARMSYARCLLKLDRKEEARAVLKALEPENPENVSRWGSLANLYYEEELYADAAEIYERMQAIEASLDAEPVLGHYRTWDRVVSQGMPNYGRIKEKQGELLAAFDLLRTYGHTQEGELLLTTHQLFDAAEASHRERRDAAARELEAIPELETDLDTGAWREASIRLADVLQFTKQWDEVLAIYTELAERLEEDFSVFEQVAALHLRAGRVDDAIATRYRVIEKKRELNRYVKRDLEPEGRILAPVPPGGQSDATTLGGRVVYMGGFSSIGGRFGSVSTGRGVGGLYDLKSDYMRIIQLHLDRQEAKEAADVLARVAREDATTFRWMSWEILEVVQNYQLGKDALPILRLLHSYEPDDDDTSLEYARALIKSSRLDEAHKILQRVVNRGNRRYYTTSQAREELDRLEARMGLESDETAADMLAAVEADPKNVKTRMKLARKLYRERRFEEALEHGRAAEELAPHQLEVSTFVTNTLTVLGELEELEGRLLEELDEEKNAQKRFAIAVRLADWKAERGVESEAVDALFDRVVEHRWGGAIQYAPSSWWMERGDLDRGRERLQYEIDQMGPDSNSSAQARYRMGELELHSGNAEFALEEIFERFEKATNHTARLNIFGELAGVLRVIADRAVARAEVERLSAKWGEPRAALLALAAELGFGEMPAFEASVDRWVQGDEGNLWLYPALVDVARQRGDLEAALAYLRRLEGLGIASRSRTAGTSIGGVSEVVALKAEIGSLLFELGRKDEALEVWSGLFGEEDQEDNRTVVASLYRLHELYAEALVPLREQLEEDDGTRKVGTLRQIAEIERELGNLDAAIAAAEQAEVLSGHATEQRLYLAALHRKRGTLPAYFDTLVAASELDPDDSALAKVVVQLGIELERDELAVAAVERVVDKPDQAKILKPYLMRMKLLRGDESAALDIYEDLLNGNVDEWQRQRYGVQLARALARRGELERAKEVLRRSYPDPDGPEAILAIAKQLVELELYEEALGDIDRVIALDPRFAEAWGLEIKCLEKLGREREALDTCFEALENPDLLQQLSAFLSPVPGLAVQLDEEARLAELLAAEAGDEEGNEQAAFRLGMVRARQHRHADAVPPLEVALGGKGVRHAALWQLGRSYLAVKRYADAERVTLELIELLDRERDLHRETWQAESFITQLIGHLREIHLRAGDVDTALALSDRTLGQTFREVSSYSYSYNNNPYRNSSQTLYWLRRHGFHEEAVRRQRFYSVFDRWSRSRNAYQIYESRYEAGDAGALEDLWSDISEPGRGLVGVPSASTSYYYSSSQANSDPRTTTLVGMFTREGRIEDLIARVEAELEIWPEDPVMRPLLLRLYEQEERWEEALTFREEDLRDAPDDDKAKQALAKVLIELGRHADALPLLEDVYRGRIADVPAGAGRQMEYFRVGGAESKRGTAGKVRFSWSGSWTGMNSTQTFFSSNDQLNLEVDSLESEARYLLMVTYAKLGREEDARELERVARSMDMLQSWGGNSSLYAMSARYATHDLPEQAERIALQALEETTDQYLGTAFYSRMCALFRRLGDDERRGAWAERWQAHLDEKIAAAPFGSALRIERARLLLRELDAPEEARAEVEQVLAWLPTLSAGRELAAWVELERGSPEAALAGFTEAERLGWIEGRGPSAELYFGQGIALAAVQGPAAARPRLQRALALDPESRFAPRAKELLE